nr:hypothetical protein [Lachnospiraceae bacterium]
RRVAQNVQVLHVYIHIHCPQFFCIPSVFGFITYFGHKKSGMNYDAVNVHFFVVNGKKAACR